MAMEHIGKYKGYDVYKVPHREMEYTGGKTLYAVAETGELVLKGEVVGRVNFNSGSVTEFDDHKCYAYKYPQKREEISMSDRRKYDYVETPKAVGGRAKAEVYDDYKGDTIGNVDLDKMITEFMVAARSTTIEDMVGVFVAEY